MIWSKKVSQKGAPTKRPPKKAPEMIKAELNTLGNYDLELPEMEPTEYPTIMKNLMLQWISGPKADCENRESRWNGENDTSRARARPLAFPIF